jgi:hypothetical protein
MTIYRLAAKGESLNGWVFRMYNKLIFKDKIQAEAYIPKFKERYCDKSEFECAVPESLKVTVHELELVE